MTTKLQNCNDCKYLSTCKQVNDHFGKDHEWRLCKWVESYVSQDTVKLKHFVSYQENMGGEYPKPLKTIRLSPREKKIAVLTSRGLSRDSICIKLNITKKTLRNVLNKLKKYYKKTATKS